jgi:hypothetical protein
VGVAVGLLEGWAEGTAVGTGVAGIITSYTSYAGSNIKGVQVLRQQKHSLVTLFQLKKKGEETFAFSEQYS